MQEKMNDFVLQAILNHFWNNSFGGNIYRGPVNSWIMGRDIKMQYGPLFENGLYCVPHGKECAILDLDTRCSPPSLPSPSYLCRLGRRKPYTVKLKYRLGGYFCLKFKS